MPQGLHCSAPAQGAPPRGGSSPAAPSPGCQGATGRAAYPHRGPGPWTSIAPWHDPCNRLTVPARTVPQCQRNPVATLAWHASCSEPRWQQEPCHNAVSSTLPTWPGTDPAVFRTREECHIVARFLRATSPLPTMSGTQLAVPSVPLALLAWHAPCSGRSKSLASPRVWHGSCSRAESGDQGLSPCHYPSEMGNGLTMRVSGGSSSGRSPLRIDLVQQQESCQSMRSHPRSKAPFCASGLRTSPFPAISP